MKRGNNRYVNALCGQNISGSSVNYADRDILSATLCGNDRTAKIAGQRGT